MVDPKPIRERYAALSPQLDERGRRCFAASEARAAGYGGIAATARATGIARSTIGRGLKELADGSDLRAGRVRRPGGGRKPLTEVDATLRNDLLGPVSPGGRGDPMSPLRWTCKGLRRLAAELGGLGHRISHTVVGELLKREGFSLQANRKTREGKGHPDRDAQFAHINARVAQAMAEKQPVISVDTKKKELVGDFKNAGREWRPSGDPEAVRVHDFLIKALGRAVPYGVYDLAANAGWVRVGIDHDTAAFAVQTIPTRWHEGGKPRYTSARRLFSFISMNWHARPLVSYQVIVDLIGSSTTKTGLSVRCELDPNSYPKGITVSDEEMAALNLVRDEFHGEWNYTIQPLYKAGEAPV